MSNNILTHDTPSSLLEIELGKTYIARDGSVVTIKKETRTLNDDGSVSVVWEGDNHLRYYQSGIAEGAEPGPSDLLIAAGTNLDHDKITEALGYIKQAEAILNPMDIVVIVSPQKFAPKDSSITPLNLSKN